MSQPDTLRQIMHDKRLARLGDAYINFVYSLALTKIKGSPQGTKVSDRTLADALRQAGMRDLLGTRVTKSDLANASESILGEAYLRKLLTIEESVQAICQSPESLTSGLSELIKLASDKLRTS